MPETITVSPTDDLQTVFDAAPKNAKICLLPGIYRQKTVIRTPGLTLVGAGADETILVYDDYALKKDADGVEYNTFRTYTMAVCADDVTMRNLTIANNARNPAEKGQEVALSVVADRFFMEDCVLSSTQDTLFVGPLPADLIVRYDGFLADELRRGTPMKQQFRSCRIEGSVDFIFGCGNARFEQCHIHSVFDGRTIGYVAAPAHALCESEGFLFANCRFTCEDAVPSESIYLARPWRDYGLVRFENCTYASHIAPEGFDKWNDTSRDQTARFFEYPAVPGRAAWVNRNPETRRNPQ